MRVGFVEWPENLQPFGPEWEEIVREVAFAKLDLLVTNELPFGRWIADVEVFDRSAAQSSIDAHATGLQALLKLDVPTIVSSRPVWDGHRLANEAFVVERAGIRALHRKQYFPLEPGWFEGCWYSAGRDGFRAAEVGAIRIGVMLCTDAMFNEHARGYGRQAAHLIAIPRAAGVSTENWLAAGKMAAIVSGCYVVSSNRTGRSDNGAVFGGAGFAFHPDGSLLATTTASERLIAIELDPQVSVRQRSVYPCYVDESP